MKSTYINWHRDEYRDMWRYIGEFFNNSREMEGTDIYLAQRCQHIRGSFVINKWTATLCHFRETKWPMVTLTSPVDYQVIIQKHISKNFNSILVFWSKNGR